MDHLCLYLHKQAHLYQDELQDLLEAERMSQILLISQILVLSIDILHNQQKNPIFHALYLFHLNI